MTINLFLSYARADGLAAAGALRQELSDMGVSVWRDLEEMRGGLDWRAQLRQALAAVDVVVVLLTPGAVASANVAWEWQGALFLNKRVIPLLIAPCDVPDELRKLHYHDFSQPAQRRLGLARLVRDLLEVAVTQAATAPTGSSKYTVINPVNSAVGDNAFVLNFQAAGGDRLAQAVLELGQQAHEGVQEQTELRQILEEVRLLSGDLQAARVELSQGQLAIRRDVRAAHNRLMARFAVSERHLVAHIVARLDEQQSAEVEAALAAVETMSSPSAELQAMQQALHETLAEVRRLGDVVDGELARQAAQLAEWAAAPQLEAKHRLLVSIPIVPWLLAYESEVELKSAANLEAAWRNLLAWLKS